MKKGFTIVEILVAVVVFIVLIVGIFAILNMADAVLNTDTGLIDLQQQARQAIDGMSKELRNSQSVSIPISLASIQFTVPIDITTSPVTYSGPISYYLVGNQIVREHPVNTAKVLANDINALSFCCGHYEALHADGLVDDYVCNNTCSSSRIVQIQLSASKTVRQRALLFPLAGVLTEKVKLRNAN